MNDDKCPRCGGPLECLAGFSAHPSNWYCKNEAGCGWQAWRNHSHAAEELARDREIRGLREEIRMLESVDRHRRERIASLSTRLEAVQKESRELQAEVYRLREKPAVPEEAIWAVWKEGYNTAMFGTPFLHLNDTWNAYKASAEKAFVEACKRGDQ